MLSWDWAIWPRSRFYRHLSHLQNAEIAALVTSDKRKAGVLARRYRVKDVYDYDQYEECLANDIDAVSIVLPNHQYCEFTVRAAKAGVHVLCEKPMAVSVAECRTMIAAMRQSRRRLMIAYRLHFEKSNPGIDCCRTEQQTGKVALLQF